MFACAGLVWHSHRETHGDDGMHKTLIAGIVALGLLAGCTETREQMIANMKSNRDFYTTVLSSGEVLTSSATGNWIISTVKYNSNLFECSSIGSMQRCKKL